MNKRKKQEEHENTDRWMVSYADFITLLFAFFTTMYAISSVNEGKYRTVGESLAAAFNAKEAKKQDTQINPELKEDSMKILITDAFKKTFSSDYKKVQSVVSEMEKSGKVNVSIEKRGIVISFSEGILFESGNAKIMPGAAAAIDEIAGMLKEMSNYVRIEGHTDNIPIKTLEFPSNWELSTARALNMLRYMVDVYGLNPGKISAIGYGEFKPVSPNDTSEGRMRNRRVDIVILNEEGIMQEPR
ncbi:MAG: OmpA family protein [Deltaproteobacteria bacterium]|nr:OmpA family protein [Deltaproteobacteria bacterium]